MKEDLFDRDRETAPQPRQPLSTTPGINEDLEKARGVRAEIGEVHTVYDRGMVRTKKKVGPGKWEWVATGRTPKDSKRVGLVPHRRLMVKVSRHVLKQGPRAGQKVTRYVRPRALPVFKASEIMHATVALGGWNQMAEPPKMVSVRDMLKRGVAKMTVGKINPKHPLIHNQDALVIPWRPESTGIDVEYRQAEAKRKRSRRIAAMTIHIPYPFAWDFISRQVASVRTRNRLLGELERSESFKKYMARTV